MRYFLLPILVLTLSASAIAQEKYFHELRGMEDSTGTTHLFYRIFESRSTTCSIDSETFERTTKKDNIYHYNVKTGENQLYLQAEDLLLPSCGTDYSVIGN